MKRVFNIQVPQQLFSDMTAAFRYSKLKKFLQNYKIKQLLSATYHPQTNGKVEKINQSIVIRLKCKVNSTDIPHELSGLNC